MSRVEHFDDPDAPDANSLIPAASAVVTNASGEILLLKRTDNSLWTIPGGAMEIGESISQTAIREVREETGLDVRPIRVIGIYSDPRHVVEYHDGEVRQQFSVCFACEVEGGDMKPSSESSEVGFFGLDEVRSLSMNPAIRRRIANALEGSAETIFD